MAFNLIVWLDKIQYAALGLKLGIGVLLVLENDLLEIHVEPAGLRMLGRSEICRLGTFA